MEVTTPGRSATEPSTPVRGLSPDRLTVSASNTDPYSRRRGVGIPLPPHEIPRLSFTLAQEEARRAERRSRRSGQFNEDNEGNSRLGSAVRSRSRSRRNSVTFDPRLSGDFAQRVKRRRRSSLVEIDRLNKRVYNPDYVEPVTVDYLKIFCKVLIAEKKNVVHVDSAKQESVAPPGPSTWSPEPYRYKSGPNLELDEFNSSLPLPSDSHPLMSPVARPDPNRIYTTAAEQEDESAIPNSPPAPKPKTFSYLERILASQGQKRQETPSYMLGPQSFKTPVSKALESPTLKISPLVIDDNSHEHRDQEQQLQLNVEKKTAQSVPEDAPAAESAMHDLPDNDIDKHTLSSDLPIDDVYNFDIPDAVEHEELNNEGILVQGLSADTNSEKFLSPIQIIEREILDPSIGGTPERTFQDVLGFSPSIIHEEYTLGDTTQIPDIIDPDSDNENANEENSQILQPTYFDDMPPTPDREPAHISGGKQIRIPHVPPASDYTSTDSSFPIGMIRKMIKASQMTGFESQVDLVPSAKQKTRLRSDVYQHVAAKSSEFILTMMQDLKAYANHRSNTDEFQITIKDVLLYLHRIHFINNNNDEIDTVARLAHSVLPTETLISLDNSIADALESRNETQTLTTDGEQLYLDGFMESESLDDEPEP